jgi:hypothetical protein
MSRLVRVLIVLGSVVALFAATTNADDLADTFRIVHKSLVLVRAAGLGSGFVIHSSPESTAILTTAQILGARRNATVYLNDDPSVGYTALLLRIDKAANLALLRIEQGRMVPMILSTSVREGERVGVAGYPSTSLKTHTAMKYLRPSLNEGTVTSVHLQGKIIEYSAPKDNIACGAAVFDSASGYYVGVSLSVKNASGAHKAVGPTAIHEFLKKSGLDITTMEYTANGSEGKRH